MLKWNTCQKSEGVLVASDETLEWLLPWWWARYRAHNHHPVAFVDLGLSHYGRSFCLERGELLTLDLDPQLASLPLHAIHWETLFGENLWKNRKGWFKKPFAALQSPFEKTLWLDLDCEVLGSVAPLFEGHGRISMAPETPPAHARERKNGTIFEDEILYNSGVIRFTHQDPLIERWALAVLEEGDQFWSDQHALSRILYQEKSPIETLHENYNWRMSQGFNLNAVIVHWVGSWGKEYIRRYGGISDALNGLPRI